MADSIKKKRPSSLSLRVSMIAVAAVLICVTAVTAPFFISDFNRTVDGERARMTNVARAFSAAVGTPMATSDLGAIYQALRGIADVPHAKFVQLVDLEQKIVAEIGNSIQLGGRDGAADEKSLWRLINAETIIVTAPVRANGQRIGELAIHSDIGWLRDAYVIRLALLLAVTLIGAVATAFIAHRIIRRTLKPLNTLSATLRDLKRDGDLSRRFDATRNDEIGVLSGAFNDAFDTISIQNHALRKYSDDLEETVRERTAQLRTAVDEAERANAAKSDFLATMSHEIRTPMNGLMVMAELLTKSGLQPRQHHFAEVISRSGNALLHIINDTLDMSKIEAGRLELEAIPFDLEGVTRDAISLFSGRAAEKNLDLTSSVDPKLAKTLIGDPTRISQILGNLINNALKFTETGGVSVTVAIAGGRDGYQDIRIHVRDTGIGIAPEKLEHVFEAFSQAEQSTNRRFGGTGLGLTISRKLAEGMGGSISVDSILNAGTTFTVELSLPVEALAPDIELSGNHCVCIATPSTIHERTLVGMLRDHGFDVVTLSDFKGTKVDLVLAAGDYANQAKSALPEVPIISIAPLSVGDVTSASISGLLGELALPITREDIYQIGACFESGDWSNFAQARADQLDALEADWSALRILSVDDNPINRQVIADTFAALGTRTDLAEDGLDAVELARAREYDVIFMDCSMPGMDGYQATKLIRDLPTGLGANSAKARIVALTANAADADGHAWKKAGMDAFVGKPFRLADIKAQLMDVLAAEQPHTAIEPGNEEHSGVPADAQTAILSPESMSMFEAIREATGEDVVTRVFPMFMDNARQGLKALNAAVDAQKESLEIKALAHSLKSMCLSAGAERAGYIAGKIESSVEMNGAAEKDLMSLEAAIEETITAMSMHLEENKVEASAAV
ncbi:MAG: ATP-binding protein [Pseudomonadota bacterium]